MSFHRPIILNPTGEKSELQNGDLLPINTIATGTPDGTKFVRDDNTLVTPTMNLVEDELDFGVKPTRSKKFTITNGLLVGSEKIVVFPSGNIAGGRGIDDWEWDTVQFAAKSDVGSFTIYAYSNTRIGGRRKIYYSIN